MKRVALGMAVTAALGIPSGIAVNSLSGAEVELRVPAQLALDGGTWQPAPQLGTGATPERGKSLSGNVAPAERAPHSTVEQQVSVSGEGGPSSSTENEAEPHNPTSADSESAEPTQTSPRNSGSDRPGLSEEEVDQLGPEFDRGGPVTPGTAEKYRPRILD